MHVDCKPLNENCSKSCKSGFATNGNGCRICRCENKCEVNNIGIHIK